MTSEKFCCKIFTIIIFNLIPLKFKGEKTMTENRINVCLSSDDNYSQHLAVTIASVLKNKAPDDELNFCILDGGITDENKKKILELKNIADCNIEFIKVDDKLFADCPIQSNAHLSLPTYYRLVIPDIKNKLDRAIYMDCDIAVKSSLKELLNIDLSDNFIAGVIDVGASKHSQRLGVHDYFNAGVLVIDLKKWRDNDITQKIFKWIGENKEKIVLHDQDIINAFFENRIKEIDEKWNTQFLRDFDKEAKLKLREANIIHYVDRKKPWLRYNGDEFTAEYLKYLKLTPYNNFLKKYYLQIIPVSLVEKLLKFIFEAKNESGSNRKVITVFGFKFYKNRKKSNL